MHGNDFGVQASELNPHLASADISVHDSGATTSLTINYEWRRLLSDLLEPMVSNDFWDGSESEIEDAIQLAQSLINDLYD